MNSTEKKTASMDELSVNDLVRVGPNNDLCRVRECVHGNRFYAFIGEDIDAERIDYTPEQIAAAPDLLAALVEAKQMLETASRYFPKSIKNSDRFTLLNVLENAVKPAIAKAEGVLA